MLSILSCVCWQSVYLLWRNVYLGLLPIFGLGCFFVIELHELASVTFAHISLARTQAQVPTEGNVASLCSHVPCGHAMTMEEGKNATVCDTRSSKQELQGVRGEAEAVRRARVKLNLGDSWGTVTSPRQSRVAEQRGSGGGGSDASRRAV